MIEGFIEWLFVSPVNQLFFFGVLDAIPLGLFQFRLWYHHFRFYREHIDSDSITFGPLVIGWNLQHLIWKGHYRSLNDNRLNRRAALFKTLFALEVVLYATYFVAYLVLA
ncbi:hypothetical protein ACWJJH_04400 [Endozoicomonadaceae bacterium StTr2]